MKRQLWRDVLVCLAVVLMMAAGEMSYAADSLPAVKGEAARFTIADDVVVSAPARFGANFDPPGMTHWGEEPFHNQWWCGPNPNPIEARVKLVATDGGEDFIDCATVKDGKKGVGMGYFDVFRDGFFDGGDVWVWRYENGKASYLRQGKILHYQASKDGPNRITLEKGPAVKAGDEFVIRAVRRDFANGCTRTMEGNPSVFGQLEIHDKDKQKAFMDGGGKMDIAADAPPGGGGGSLRIVVPQGAVPTTVGNWLISNQQADWPRLKDGADYQLSFWAKQDGMSAPLKVQVASLGKAEFKVDAQWTQYTVKFKGAPPKATEPLTFTITGAGTLYLDNIFIHELGDTPPDAFYPVVVDALRRYQPRTLRLWTLQSGGFGRSLDMGLGPISESNLEFTETGGGRSVIAVDLYQELDLCAKIGADPWIVVSTKFSPDEYRNLIEYLAGGPDTPYGKKRAARGRVQPWTAAFNKIKLELGNETWNGMFGSQGFSGRPKDYGQYGDLVFRTMKATPGYDPDKFTFVLNGWVAGTSRKWGYGPLALDNCPSADESDMAYYTGGWDAVGLIKPDSPQWGWFNILTYSYRMLRPRSEECAASIRAIAADRKRPASLAVYEAGPGYTLPAPGKFNIEEQREGKSMAQAVNALDVFMLNLKNGFDDQLFFTFRNGHYWSSHNRQWGEHIAWKALSLRNTQLKGDLITATPAEMVSIDLPEAKADTISQSNSADHHVTKFPAMKDVPLVACYPFKQGNRYSYMLYSRRIDGPTKVTLDLPYDPKPEVHLYKLASDDLAAHNIDKEVVTVQEEVRQDAARSYAVTLPAGSIMVLVNEAK